MLTEFTRDIDVTATLPSITQAGDEDVIHATVRAVTYYPIDDDTVARVVRDATRRLAATRRPRTPTALVAAMNRAARATHTLPWQLQIVSAPARVTARETAGGDEALASTSRRLDALDEDGRPLHVGDIVTLFDVPGRVVVECDAAGIACDGGIDYDELERRAKLATSSLDACRNDHFISLWELAWNLDATDSGIIPGLRVTGDTPRDDERGVTTCRS